MPVYRFRIDVPLSNREVEAKLHLLTRPRPQEPSLGKSIRAFGISLSLRRDPVSLFTGKIDAQSFRIKRRIRYRNSFLPLIWGRITPIPTGSRISVTMFMHPLVIVFMGVWLSGVGYGVWRCLHDPVPRVVAIVPFLMFLFGVGLLSAGFFPEAFKARRLIEDALFSERAEARETSN